MANFCSNCGETLKDGIKICTNCGNDITNENIVDSNELINNEELKSIIYDIAEIKNNVINISSKIKYKNNIETSNTGTFNECFVKKIGACLAYSIYTLASLIICLTVDFWVQFRDSMAYGSLIFLIGGITIGIICFLIGMLINYFIATFANISINLHEIAHSISKCENSR